MAEAEDDTFRWILDDGFSTSYSYDGELRQEAAQQFRAFLQHENGVYFVCGKPGSGKSTVMKFLAQEPRVKGDLQQWAGNKMLCMATFFF